MSLELLSPAQVLESMKTDENRLWNFVFTSSLVKNWYHMKIVSQPKFYPSKNRSTWARWMLSVSKTTCRTLHTETLEADSICYTVGKCPEHLCSREQGRCEKRAPFYMCLYLMRVYCIVKPFGPFRITAASSFIPCHLQFLLPRTCHSIDYIHKHPTLAGPSTRKKSASFSSNNCSTAKVCANNIHLCFCYSQVLLLATEYHEAMTSNRCDSQNFWKSMKFTCCVKIQTFAMRFTWHMETICRP